MRFAPTARRGAALVAILAAGACSDDPAAPSNERTTAEAAELAAILADLAVEQGFSAAGSGATAAPAAGPAAVPVTFSTNVEFTASCPLGGAVQVDADLAGTVDGETGLVDATMTVVQTHAACVAEGSETGTVFTLDGAPDITVTMNLESNAQSGAFVVAATFVGGVAWAADGRNGTCSMNLDIASSGNSLSGTGSGSVTGSICGITVSQTAGF